MWPGAYPTNQKIFDIGGLMKLIIFLIKVFYDYHLKWIKKSYQFSSLFKGPVDMTKSKKKIVCILSVCTFRTYFKIIDFHWNLFKLTMLFGQFNKTVLKLILTEILLVKQTQLQRINLLRFIIFIHYLVHRTNRIKKHPHT